MILYKDPTKQMKKFNRPIKTIDMKIEEYPTRPSYGTFRNNKERKRYVDMVKAIVRSAPEYREYVAFLKKYMHMDKCVVFNKLENVDGKKYRIELHHAPFTLAEIINVVVSKRQRYGESMNPYKTADEVLALHYDGKVGLINLSITAHELAENGRVFIPLQWIYQDYPSFVEEYEDHMDKKLKEKIELYIKMSLQCDQIVSDCMDPTFTYINIDGFAFPEVPDEWGNSLKDTVEAFDKEGSENE